MRHPSSLRNWIAIIAVAFITLTGAASLSAQGTQNSRTDIQFHKFVPIVAPENSSFAASSSDPAQINSVIAQQVQLLMQEKASRTPAQQKIDSNVLYTIRMMRGQQAAPGVTSLYTGVDLDQDNRIVVDIVANVTDELLKQLQSAGALVLDSHKEYRAIRAIVPPDQIEIIAASPDVTFIGRKAESITSRLKFTPTNRSAVKGTLTPGFEARAARVRKQIAAFLQQRAGTNGPGVPTTGSGSVETQGDAAHTAITARGLYGVNGSGLKIGVLSDSANNAGSVTSAQATGDMPPTCPGPGGPCLTILQDRPSGGSDEGTAMMEIIYDMAPGANLFFATADISEASFASNIQALRTAGCDIIVDDVFYFDEPVFQDGIVAQAVNTVTTSGALYFSSAGNEGNLDAGTAGYFEGDFNDAGSVAFTFPGGAKTGTIHNFGTVGTPVNGDIITASGDAYTLNWADPSGTSGNDYDLFLVSSAGTIKGSSTNIQSGTQNPFEIITPPSLVAGDRLVVFKTTAAAARAFAINTVRGTLTLNTSGQTHGHSAAVNSFSVAATPAAGAFSPTSPIGPFPNAFTTANLVEPFSSDGPRRVFFNADGTPITPGNFLFGTNGGTVRNKPDITAADGVSTTVNTGGLNPFYGTSAAAPSAASVAALLKSANPALTPAQIRTVLTTTALDVMAAGYDRNSGNGIVMALAALNTQGLTGFADLEFGTITANENPGNGNGILEAGEGGQLVIQLKNTNGVQDAKNISAVLTSTTPGVTVTLPGTSTYPNLPLGTGVGTNVSAFNFTLASNLACGTVINFTLTVTYTNGPAATKVMNFSVPIVITLSNTLGGASPIGMPAGMTFTTGSQTGRLLRSGVASSCGTTKPNPGLTALTGARLFDAYTFTTAPGVTGCMTTTFNGLNGSNMYQATYTPSFVPATPNVNYAADPGDSNFLQSYGLTATGSTAYTIVVHNINVGDPGSAYTLQIPACMFTNPATINHPPVAVVHDVTVIAAAVGGTAAANIDNGSTDADGDTLTKTQSPPGPYPVGVTSVMLTVTDTKGASSQASANVTVVNPVPDLTITKTHVGNFAQGQVGATYTITVTNSGGASTSGTVTVVDTLPASMTATALTGTGWSCTLGTLTCTRSDVIAQTIAYPTITLTVTVSGSAPASVTNTATVSGGGETNTANDVANDSTTITSGNPVPAVTTISPTNTPAGSGAFTLTVNGTNFVAASVVNFNGFAKTTTFVSATQLTASILAVDIASGGTDPVTVFNPTPGGGTSNIVNFTVNNPVPAITTILPTNTLAGSAAFTLTVNGSSFVSSSVVNFNGSPRATSFQNSGQVSATILSTDVLTAGTFPITVTNPTPAGGTSNSVTFTVNNVVPTVTTLSPTGATAGSGALTLTVNGTGFVSNSTVNFNGAARVTTFVNSTQVTAAIFAIDVALAGTPPVTVTNPNPGGGTSNFIAFNISAAAVPDLTITKTHVGNFSQGQVGATYTITVSNGGSASTTGTVTVVDTLPTGLTPTAMAGTGWACTFTTGTCTRSDALTASGSYPAITLTVTVAGNAAASVTNSVTVSGGGETNTANDIATNPTTITTTNPVPALTSLSPNTASAGSGAFTLTVNGSNFISSSVVQWNGSTRVTTFVGATQLTAAITAADVQTANLDSASVLNPTPGGGTSNVLTFTVSTPIPALTSLVPNSAIAGGAAFTLTVNGSNFLNTSVAQWNGSNRTTTFVNSTQLTAQITAADILAVGTASVRVFTPTVVFAGPEPLGISGTTSNALTFTITAANPVPTLTSIAPTSTGAGGAAFTLTLNGTNFISSSVAQWKGSARTTTFVSATQLTAAITAADVATSGTAAITVVNPTPGGGTSNSLTFTITDFSVTSPTGPQTVPAGQSANFTINTAPVGGAFPSNVTFTASGLPAASAATFNPASVAPGSSTTMTITTTARGLAQTTRPPFRPAGPMRPLWILAFVLALALSSLTLARFGRRAGNRSLRRLIPIGAFALLLISVGYLSGCAGGFPKVGSNTGTPAGTYPITVTGTSGTVQHTTTVTLIVQ